jgi:phosphatidate cytidylyltransferase
MLLHYVLILNIRYGSTESYCLSLAIWVIAVAKFTDVGGYLVGSMIGRHKLAPSISPGKTWEGVVGGLLLSALVAFLPVHFAQEYFPLWLTPLRAVCLAFPIGIAAIASDLSESAFKRRAGVKDSGRCIPGIGGALDLADSLLLAGPVAYYLFLLVQR